MPDQDLAVQFKKLEYSEKHPEPAVDENQCPSVGAPVYEGSNGRTCRHGTYCAKYEFSDPAIWQKCPIRLVYG